MTSESQQKSQRGKQKGILDKLKFLDIFGSKPIFNVNGEDKFKTIMGVLWSLLMIFVLFSGLIYYFLIYIRSQNPDVATQIIRTDKYDPIDLGASDFFISLAYRRSQKSGEFEGIESFNTTWFRVDAYHITGSGSTPEERKNIPLTKCLESGINQDQYVGDRETAFHVNSSCIKFQNNTIIGGSPGSPDFKYIEIQVFPCMESADEGPEFSTSCKTHTFERDRTMQNDVGDRMKLAFTRIRDFTFRLSLVQTGANLENFKQPLTKTIDSNNELRMGLFQEYYRTYFFQSYKVEDTTGWFSDINKGYEGISLDRSTTETTTREPWFKANYANIDGQLKLRGTNYMTIRFQASNQKQVISRKYKKLIDVFSEVGGLA